MPSPSRQPRPKCHFFAAFFGVSDEKLAELNAELVAACTRGDVERIRSRRTKGATLEATDVKGNSVLHLAVASGSLPAVKALLEKAPATLEKELEAQNKAGSTPLLLGALLWLA